VTARTFQNDMTSVAGFDEDLGLDLSLSDLERRR
jgi:hypothetical protein